MAKKLDPRKEVSEKLYEYLSKLRAYANSVAADVDVLQVAYNNVFATGMKEEPKDRNDPGVEYSGYAEEMLKEMEAKYKL